MKKELTEIEKSYLAGIVDGEGSIYIAKNGVALTIANTNKTLIDWIDKRTEGYYYVKKQPKEVDSTCYVYYITGKKLSYFLQQIRPYLIVKRKQADIALNYIKTIQSKGKVALPSHILKKRETLRNKLKKLNKRGKGE